MEQQLRTVMMPTRRQSPLLVLLLAFAVTYLFSSLPFGNPHIGFLKPMALGHARVIHPHAPRIVFADSKAQRKLDNSHEWATDKLATPLHLDWAVGPRLFPLLLTVVVARLVLTEPRAPPIALWRSHPLRAPPLHR